MTESSREERSTDLRASENGLPRGEARGARYCGFCGAEVGTDGATLERFGELFCSESHAEEFVKGVRAARVQAAAAGGGEVQRADEIAPKPPPGAAKPWDRKRALKMAACCGVPMLALVVLAGGGGALLGAAGALLPLLAVLACPLGMFFMMRAMSKGHQQQPKDKEGDK